MSSFESGAYRRVYQQAKIVYPEDIPMSDKALFHRRDGAGGVLFATRGCPHRCDFCTIAVMYPHRLRKRPVPEVAAGYASFSGRVIIFW